MTLDLHFDNSYGRLPERFFTRQEPTPVAAPGLVALNGPLAAQLGLDANALASTEGLQALAGNTVPDGADPLAQVYAGHQFGHFSPQLGDGRAVLLGEVVTPDGTRFDLQLKGAGPTPYSRMGDGRAWLGPVMREYIASEAMSALGVPTTRALAAVTTGETVLREAPFPGAVLTRVASSHLRVGTFQFFAARGDTEALEALVAYALDRHYPDADDAKGLLQAVLKRQAKLIAQWMGLGFVHGVMNTDNMSISGETIDYGPCAFIDTYHPMRVFSSIDHAGRYAFSRQPDIALWNLAQLATSLLPLIGPVEDAQGVLDGFPDIFRAEWSAVFRAKLGLRTQVDGDGALGHDLLNVMGEQHADFTNTFRALGTEKARDQFLDPQAYDAWAVRWRDRLALENTTPEDRQDALQAVNPALIPRTHRIEEAIQAGVAGDYSLFERLNVALTTPFDDPGANADLARAPTAEE
ncbi:YdiU family protein, partial [bacterium]|nr:YdiU family protein [bacterium]